MPLFAHWYGLLVMLVFWGGVIALGIWAFRRVRPSDSGDSALSILNERFARGEIDQQEYEQRKGALRR